MDNSNAAYMFGKNPTPTKITMTSKEKEVKLKKDGTPKKTHTNRVSGVSSEVYPFRRKEDIQAMKDVFRSRIKFAEEYGSEKEFKVSWRNLSLFCIGINCGLRVSDLLNLKYSDMLYKVGDSYEFRELTRIKPKKTARTGKFVTLYFNEGIQDIVLEYILAVKPENLDDYMFKNFDTNNPLTSANVWDILKKAAKEAGIRENIGTHSMRKTYGYWHWINAPEKDKALVTLQIMFGHTNSLVTSRYIGVMQEDIQEFNNSVCL